MKKQTAFMNGFNNFVTEMMNKYQVTRDEVLKVADAFGDFRNKIWAYFVVQNYLKKNGLPLESTSNSVVNRWFP